MTTLQDISLIAGISGVITRTHDVDLTDSDYTGIDGKPFLVYATGAGNVIYNEMKDPTSTDRTLALAADELMNLDGLIVGVKRILQTGTTATGLRAIYL